MLNWANQFNIFCLLDNLQYDFSTPSFECLLAVGSKHQISVNAGNAFGQLKAFHNHHRNEWMFGHFGYDLKNENANLSSNKFDGIKFPDLFFFVPQIVLQLDNEKLVIHGNDAESIFEEIKSFPSTVDVPGSTRVNAIPRIGKQQYIETIEILKQHILRGDCYEINFCQEFYDDRAAIDPLSVYDRLTSISPNPFSAFYRVNEKYCCCASPERFLKKSGNRITSQPIKGTSKRNLNEPLSDFVNREYLLNSTKEKSENVMVVDLVRNDLSRFCKPGTVKVDELFGVYSFPQVHQMISTVSGEAADNIHPVDMIRESFPMGSMTGAPKHRVMELIEEYEHTKRGIFSGAIGYFNPSGDFDLNVVIRSVMYNAADHYLSFQAGSGITFYCDAESEYEECMLKAAAIKSILM